MTTQRIVVRHAEGLHARPAELIARLAMEYQADIRIAADAGHQIDAKSILDVLTLGATQGTELTLTADGKDEEQAIAAVAELIQSDFGLPTTTTQ